MVLCSSRLKYYNTATAAHHSEFQVGSSDTVCLYVGCYMEIINLHLKIPTFKK